MVVQQLEDFFNIVRANLRTWLSTAGLRANDVSAEWGMTVKVLNVRPKVFIHASEKSCSDFRERWEIFLLSEVPYSMSTCGCYPEKGDGGRGRGAQLTARLHLVPTSKMNKAASPSYNKSQQDAQFLKFIWRSTPHVSDRSTVHHQEYLSTVYTQ